MDVATARLVLFAPGGPCPVVSPAGGGTCAADPGNHPVVPLRRRDAHFTVDPRPLPGIARYALGCACLLLWWVSIKPSNQRVWADDVARMTSGSVNSDQVILHNVRNFDWRTNTDYTQRWKPAATILAQLRSVDLITSYWSMAAIAHVLVSFGFTDGQQMVFSVEIPLKALGVTQLVIAGPATSVGVESTAPPCL